MSEPIETPEETAARLENVVVMLADDNERCRAKLNRCLCCEVGKLDIIALESLGRVFGFLAAFAFLAAVAFSLLFLISLFT